MRPRKVAHTAVILINARVSQKPIIDGPVTHRKGVVLAFPLVRLHSFLLRLRHLLQCLLELPLIDLDVGLDLRRAGLRVFRQSPRC